MKKYFERIKENSIIPDRSKIERYKEELIKVMKSKGASESDISLVCDEMIINAINNNRNIESVAEAILQ